MKISYRELEVLRLVSHGNNFKQIADKLFLSTHTVISHCKNLKHKFDAQNGPELVRRGFELGYLR